METNFNKSLQTQSAWSDPASIKFWSRYSHYSHSSPTNCLDMATIRSLPAQSDLLSIHASPGVCSAQFVYRLSSRMIAQIGSTRSLRTTCSDQNHSILLDETELCLLNLNVAPNYCVYCQKHTLGVPYKLFPIFYHWTMFHWAGASDLNPIQSKLCRWRPLVAAAVLGFSIADLSMFPLVWESTIDIVGKATARAFNPWPQRLVTMSVWHSIRR